MSTEQPVLAERRGRVLLVTLNRPDRLNAWTNAMEERYFELLDEADADPDIRAVVLTGAGKGFCVGGDAEELEAAGSGEVDTHERERPRSYPLTARVPIVAAINGACAALGLIEALYCDVRFTTPDAKFTTGFARRGLVAVYGLSWLLPRIVGYSNALDLLLSGRVVKGEEAQRLGLVHRVVAPEALLDEAIAYADDLAENCSPTAMAAIKQQVREDWAKTFDQAFVDADVVEKRSYEWPDLAEGMNSFLEKRPADFPALAPRA